MFGGTSNEKNSSTFTGVAGELWERPLTGRGFPAGTQRTINAFRKCNPRLPKQISRKKGFCKWSQRHGSTILQSRREGLRGKGALSAHLHGEPRQPCREQPRSGVTRTPLRSPYRDGGSRKPHRQRRCSAVLPGVPGGAIPDPHPLPCALVYEPVRRKLAAMQTVWICPAEGSRLLPSGMAAPPPGTAAPGLAPTRKLTAAGLW